MIYNRPFRDAAKKYCLLGKPEDCLEQMRAFAGSGCRHFVYSPLMDAEEFVERCGREILPRVRETTPTPT
jgi:alkanesulfonate monooxygenase SsuD/methylene tetrahydromethanopterin reductase-like flavin-dependent oxidoreductase (luciferase family)